MLDKEKIYDFLIEGSKLITALAVFSALFVALVKYATQDLRHDIDTIKNNHLEHVNSDIQELKSNQNEFKKENKKEHEDFVQEIKELKRENTEEHKELRKGQDVLNEKINKQGNDISYIRGLLEKQFGVKK
jgi:septal ring factor EnvC (AmiA/AmiB activator)